MGILMATYKNELTLLCDTTKYEPYVIFGKQYKGNILDDNHYVIIIPQGKCRVVEKAYFEEVRGN